MQIAQIQIAQIQITQIQIAQWNKNDLGCGLCVCSIVAFDQIFCVLTNILSGRVTLVWHTW